MTSDRLLIFRYIRAASRVSLSAQGALSGGNLGISAPSAVAGKYFTVFRMFTGQDVVLNYPETQSENEWIH